jgi:hypothetical protein
VDHDSSRRTAVVDVDPAEHALVAPDRGPQSFRRRSAGDPAG